RSTRASKPTRGCSGERPRQREACATRKRRRCSIRRARASPFTKTCGRDSSAARSCSCCSICSYGACGSSIGSSCRTRARRKSGVGVALPALRRRLPAPCRQSPRQDRCQVAEQVVVHRDERVLTFAANRENVGLGQYLHMVRNRRLRKAELFHHLTAGQLAR